MIRSGLRRIIEEVNQLKAGVEKIETLQSNYDDLLLTYELAREEQDQELVDEAPGNG